MEGPGVPGVTVGSRVILTILEVGPVGKSSLGQRGSMTSTHHRDKEVDLRPRPQVVQEGGVNGGAEGLDMEGTTGLALNLGVGERKRVAIHCMGGRRGSIGI